MAIYNPLKPTKMKNKKSTFKLETPEAIILWLIGICLVTSLFSCTPVSKGHCDGNRRMMIHGGGGYR
jgi:hypothetical protein